RRAARAGAPGAVRAAGDAAGAGGAPPACLLRAALRGAVPALPRDPPRGADRELRTGAQPALQRESGPVAPFRALARPAQGSPRRLRTRSAGGVLVLGGGGPVKPGEVRGGWAAGGPQARAHVLRPPQHA